MHESYFGLRRPPFQGSAVAALRETAAFLAAEACARRALAQARALVAITGPAGSATPSLIEALESEPPAGTVAVRLRPEPGGDPREALRAAIGGGQGTASGRPPAETATGAGRRRLLLVDGADALPEDALEALLDAFDPQASRGATLVLAGRPALARRLAGRRAVRCRIGAMDEAEVARYVTGRLRAAGHAGGDLFTPEALQRLARVARGLPGLVDRVGTQALGLAYLGAERTISPAMIRPVAAPADADDDGEDGADGEGTGVDGPEVEAVAGAPTPEPPPISDAGMDPARHPLADTGIVPHRPHPALRRHARKAPVRRRRRGGRWLALALVVAAVAALVPRYLELPLDPATLGWLPQPLREVLFSGRP